MLETGQSAPDRKRLVMVMGVQRSGTTAVFKALAGSPAVTARNEAADDDIYDDYFLRPEPRIRSLLHSLPGTVLLKPVRETERRPIAAVDAEYVDYDLRMIWLHRNPLDVFASYVRLGWATESVEAARAFANEWVKRNESALAAVSSCGPRLLIVRHEDLVMHPERLAALAIAVGLSTTVTLGMNISDARRKFSSGVQAIIEARTADVRRRLESVGGADPPANGDSPVLADPSQSVLYHPKYSEALVSADPAATYAQWRGGGALQTVSCGESWYVAAGYEAAQAVLASSRPYLPFPRSHEALGHRAPALEEYFSKLRPAWRTSIRGLVARRVQAQGAGDPFMLSTLVVPIITDVNAVWMDCPREPLDAACTGLVLAANQRDGCEMSSEVARFIDSLQATGLLRRLIDHGLLDPVDTVAFIYGTAVRTYLLSVIMPNALGIAARNPSMLDHLRARPAEIPGFLIESIRLMPPWIAVKRLCTEPLSAGGCDIPAGSMVDVIVGAANRDPAMFPDPDRCLLDRTGPLPIMLEAEAANYLRLQDDAPWPAGSLMLDTVAITLEAMIAGDRPLRIVSLPTSRLVPWPDGSCVAVPGEMVVAFGD